MADQDAWEFVEGCVRDSTKLLDKLNASIRTEGKRVGSITLSAKIVQMEQTIAQTVVLSDIASSLDRIANTLEATTVNTPLYVDKKAVLHKAIK